MLIEKSAMRKEIQDATATLCKRKTFTQWFKKHRCIVDNMEI